MSPRAMINLAKHRHCSHRLEFEAILAITFRRKSRINRLESMSTASNAQFHGSTSCHQGRPSILGRVDVCLLCIVRLIVRLVDLPDERISLVRRESHAFDRSARILRSFSRGCQLRAIGSERDRSSNIAAPLIEGQSVMACLQKLIPRSRKRRVQ